MINVHRIALDLNNVERTQCAKAAGVARFAYNWALAEWKRQYAAGEKPSEAALRRQLNAIKREKFPWMLDVSKRVPQQAVMDLGDAYKRAFRLKKCFPRFKKKGVARDSFRVDNGPGTFRVDGERIRLPKIGWLRMHEALRFEGTLQSATVSRTADRWFVAVSVKSADTDAPDVSGKPVIGVDLGIRTMAVTSDGREFHAPKALRRNLKKMARLQRKVSRRVKGSANRAKAKHDVARLHARIGNIRKDALHKATTAIARSASVIVLENLNVKGMMQNRKLARAIADVGFYEFRRQIGYKASREGAVVKIADRWFPSSKKCSNCGVVRATLPLHVRNWTCEACGSVHDRDRNASTNLRNLATASSAGGNACGVDGSALAVTLAHPATLKQEADIVVALGGYE